MIYWTQLQDAWDIHGKRKNKIKSSIHTSCTHDGWRAWIAGITPQNELRELAEHGDWSSSVEGCKAIWLKFSQHALICSVHARQGFAKNLSLPCYQTIWPAKYRQPPATNLLALPPCQSSTDAAQQERAAASHGILQGTAGHFKRTKRVFKGCGSLQLSCRRRKRRRKAH